MDTEKSAAEKIDDHYKRYNYTPLMIAIADKDYDQIAKLLACATKEQVCEFVNHSGCSNAVYEAVRKNDIRACQLLLASGKADFDIIPSEKNHDVDHDYEQDEQCTPLRYRVMQPMDEECSKMIRWLVVVAGVDVNHRDICGQTVLNDVAYEKNFELLQFLIDKGANVNNCNYKSKLSLLSDMVVEGVVETVEFLCSLTDKIEFNQWDAEGNTALHHAVAYPSARMTKALLSTGKCDLHQANNDDCTPLDLALLNREKDEYEKIISLLEEQQPARKKQKHT